MITIDERDNTYFNINAHPDLIYELKMWEEIKDEMQYPKNDNNDGLIYGIYWLDDNGQVCDVEWFKTEQERFDEVDETNKRLRLAFYGEIAK